MNNIFASILPIFIITMLGSIIRRKWLTSEEFWRGLEKLSYFLLFPLVLFNYTSSIETSSKDLIKLTLALMLSITIVCIILIVYQKRAKDCKVLFTSLFQGSVRFNSYIFLGLGNGMFGSKGMEIIAVVSSYMIIFSNAISVLIFSIYVTDISDAKIKSNFLNLTKNFISNPLIIASFTGFIFNYFDIVLNVGIKKTIDTLSNAALAIGVMNVGARLQFNLNAKHIKQVLLASFTKLIILPIVTIIVFFSLVLLEI